MNRPGKWFLLGAILAILAFLALRARTPAIRDSSGHVIAGSIASLERARIGGVEQWMLIRGEDQRNPVLLFVHGGPGLPLMPFAHSFQRALEKNFVVVQWDQRGAGKSYGRGVAPTSLNQEQLLSDAHEVADLLRARFHQQKIFVAGHSWGTYLGLVLVQRYPELFHAYIGIGQVGDATQIAALQEQFVRSRAAATGDTAALRQLAGGDEGARKSLVVHFGGDLYGAGSSWPLFSSALRAPEYSLVDYYRELAGLIFYYRHMDPALRHAGPAGTVNSVAVPVYFFLGQHDFVAPTALAVTYLEQLQAPRKKVVLFFRSAHFPFFEEPGKFAEEMARVRQETLAP